MSSHPRPHDPARAPKGIAALVIPAAALALALIGFTWMPRPSAPATPAVQFTLASQAAPEAGAAVVLRIELDQVHTQDVIVPYAVSGSATETVDYTLTVGPATIPAGQTFVDLSLAPIDDGLYEGDELATVTLGTPTGGVLGIQLTHDVTVQDDEAAPSVSFLSAAQKVPEASPPLAVDFQLSAAAGIDIQVAFATAGDATQGIDYSTSSSPVLIPAGQTQGQIQVTPIDDPTGEGTERIVLVLQPGSHVSLGAQPTHTIRLTNDDGPVTDNGSHPRVPFFDHFPAWIDFGSVRVGEVSPPQQVLISNNSGQLLLLQNTLLHGAHRNDFIVTPQSPLPVSLPDGASVLVDVQFAPTAQGPRNTFLFLRQRPNPGVRLRTRLTGVAFGPTGAEARINSGGGHYAHTSGEAWAPDYGFTPGGTIRSTPSALQGTTDPTLYQTARSGAAFGYSIALPNGPYDVTLHFAEIVHTQVGARIFSVDLEGQAAITDLDLVATVGENIAYSETHPVSVADGVLDLAFAAANDEALVCGIEIRSRGVLTASPGTLNFGVIDTGQSLQLDVMLQNTGLHDTRVEKLRIRINSGDGEDFDVLFDGTSYAGDLFNVVYDVDRILTPGEVLPVPVTFSPTEHAQHDLELWFESDTNTEIVSLLGVSGFAGDPYMHPVIVVPTQVVDYDDNGNEDVLLDGTDSHTHEPGHVLTAWEWRENSVLISSLESVFLNFPIGSHQVELTIEDDNVPPRVLATSSPFEVVPVDAVPGVMALYYEADLPTVTPSDLLDAIPANPDFAEPLPGFLADIDDGISTSGYSGGVMVRIVGTLDVAVSEPMDFSLSGGVDQRIELDGIPVTGTVNPTVGPHLLEVRFAVDDLVAMPLEVLVSLSGAPAQPIDGSLLTHDPRTTPPVINSMPTEGSNLGGNAIVIAGFGFFPFDQVTVHWGSQTLTQVDFTAQAGGRIEFISPPGSGIIQVSVQTPAGTSDLHAFEYQLNGPVPINFTSGPDVTVSQPTAAAWGPDGRLYVTSRDGTLRAITYDAQWNATQVDSYTGVSALGNHEVMGIAFDPFDGQSPVQLYIAHTEMYAQGGTTFSGPAPYPGQVSRLSGPNFDTPVTVIDLLPTSNHDHGVNGMVFDNNGDLLIGVGGNTNAGIPFWKIGDLPESPLSAAILKARLSRPDFDGMLEYLETVGGAINNDQVFGEVVDLAPGTHVDVHAMGLRNPFDLCYTVGGRLWATDNGPNNGFGLASTGASSQSFVHPWAPDELNLIEYGHYYGHAHRGRGRTNDHENVYRNTTVPTQDGFTQLALVLPSSTNGLIEYRATTFGDQMRGDLLAMKWGEQLRRIQLDAAGRTVLQDEVLSPWLASLNIIQGPGGAVLGIDYSGNQVRVLIPNDLAVQGPTAYDITPWRALSTGGSEFVIGGENLGDMVNTTVTIDGIQATLTSVTATRIHGVVPAQPSPGPDPVDVVVTVSGSPQTIPAAFRYLYPNPGLEVGVFRSEAPMPWPLGEVACGEIGGVLFVVGEGSNKTLAYDLIQGTWVDNLAVRPFVGHHHAAEVHDGLWYLIGGLGSGQGKVQIYDPVANTWSLGSDMPWNGGSASSCLIGDTIYVSGGIVGSTTVDNCASYDIPTDTWTPLAPMASAKGRNHGAGATDGERFFIFGGRGIGSGAGNFVANGFADVQIYDPATDTWEASFDVGSTLTPLPIGRGGTGPAVFDRGEFYVFGGETSSGPGAAPGNVYDRVDVYDPVTNSWRLEARIPTPRHGLFAVMYQGDIYLAGGGVVAGFSASDVLEVLSVE